MPATTTVDPAANANQIRNSTSRSPKVNFGQSSLRCARLVEGCLWPVLSRLPAVAAAPSPLPALKTISAKPAMSRKGAPKIPHLMEIFGSFSLSFRSGKATMRSATPPTTSTTTKR